MELRALKAFVEVARQGSFSLAAKSLFLTQSAVSKSVKQLEDDLGVILLDRLGHRSAMTTAGEVVFVRAVKMLTERDDLVTELSELRGLRLGKLRLGLPPIGSDVLFAPLFTIYRSRYPGIEIQLAEYGSKKLEELVRSGEVDLGASLLPLPDEFEWRSVREEPMEVLLPAWHARSRDEKLALGMLKDEPFILFDNDFALNALILKACEEAGFQPNIVARSSQTGFIVELVASGLGIGFLPRFMAEGRKHSGVCHRPVIDPSISWHLAWMWRKGSYLSHASRAWLDLDHEPNMLLQS
ncbi:LysR family transcriptional regulator [Pararhizobium gei]|uniref:LysR family transcriptional regulator n=1 Tax=Pararhizobium gei TaxID=1395951 RepID=UPI0023DADE7E|nr:LysR family transcriptional regulator [Rhizobium gei]